MFDYKILNLNISKNRSKIFFITIIIFLIFLAYHNRFLLDDAFISFRYAENFANGDGLVWNINSSEKVEGYTNFLWVMILSFFHLFMADLPMISQILGLVIGFFSLYFIYDICQQLKFKFITSLLSIVLIGTNYTFSSFITSGLETQLQVCLILLIYKLTYFLKIQRAEISKYFLIISLLSALALMTRLDSLVLCSPIVLSNLFILNYKQNSWQYNLNKIAYLIFPGMFLILSWFAFKLYYYGNILPNPFYVKTQTVNLAIINNGFCYIWSFFKQYYLLLPSLVVLIKIRSVFTKPGLGLMLIVCIFWFLYCLSVGGDFMEYRFIVPVLPFIYLIATYVLLELKIWFVIIVLILSGSLSKYNQNIICKNKVWIEPIVDLKNHLFYEKENWIGVGKKLAEIFPGSSGNIKIATTAAGAIPYYSKLETVDMLGLNDLWISRNGSRSGNLIAHQLSVPIEYLIQAKVNLVFGHPRVFSNNFTAIKDLNAFFLHPIDIKKLTPALGVIQIPIDNNYHVDALYLTKHELIEQAILNSKIKFFKLK